MQEIKVPLSYKDLEDSVISRYVARLKDYGYKPNQSRLIFLDPKNLKYKTRLLVDFDLDGYKVTFLISRNGYRFKVEHRKNLLYRTIKYADPKDMERHFMTVFNDSEPLYYVIEPRKMKGKKHERTAKVSSA